MRRPPSRAYVIGLFATVVVAIGVLAGVRGIDYVTRHTTTVQTHHRTVVVAMPCVSGDDAACRRFLELLLSDATRRQLEQLLAVRSIHVPARGLPRLVARLQGLLRPHHHHRRGHPPPVLPRPPSPFSPIPPIPPAAPVQGVMPGHGNGLPGRPSPATVGPPFPPSR